MQKNITKLLGELGNDLIDNPFFSIMIVDQKLTIVWHNRNYADVLGAPDGNFVGKKCFEATSSEAMHRGCPTLLTIKEENIHEVSMTSVRIML